MNSKCDFCSNEFVSIYTLKIHQNTSKKCLEIQGKINCDKIEFIKIIL